MAPSVSVLVAAHDAAATLDEALASVAAQTAASMLRKMADMIEDQPDFLSQRAGAAVRRMPDGSTQRKQLTIKGMLAAAEEMSAEERAKLHAMLDEIRVQIDDPDKGDDLGGSWGGSTITGPGLD